MFESALRWWCRRVHNNVFHPMHGKYICGVCLREWPVPWAEPRKGEYAALKPQSQQHANTDVVVTSAGRGLLLIRLPIQSFRSTPGTQPADGALSGTPAGSR
jgi:hypothetical protein